MQTFPRSTEEGPPNSTVEDQMIWQWPLLIFGAYVAVIGSSLQALQTKGPFPVSSQLVFVALVISFSALILSVYIRQDNKKSSLVAAHVGIFFGVNALMGALVANLETPFMVISVTVYSISILLNIFNLVREKLNSSPTATQTFPHSTEEGPSNSTVEDQMIWQWPLLVFGACFATIGSALQALYVGSTLQSLQTKGPFPMSSQLVFVALVISFSALILSVYIRPDNQKASLVAAHVGIFFGANAFLGALVANLETPFMVISFAVYSIGILLIIFAKIVKSTT